MADSLIRVEGGTPTPTELAAVLLVLLSATRAQEAPAHPTAPPRATWGPARGWRPPGTWPAP
ncbi:acyl-CoA carboxylase epsilon subunit [Streptomyces sp. NPDC087866]|uniref:acyl-CoA carboxylase epsilon subunit n=1 Tax=unclassified Streptomyces TaxID=2593676 RepID=UPI00224E69C6|nr:acyl-CoA carboxylase epsilon subunit [Streptomyces sp. NBC_01789]MCX4447981.1 acyl-CoA carboxylase epsilon subunit [Streptomyces sp. NBC_01789]